MDLQVVIDRLRHGGTCLVVSLRHLGDAVIASGLINALHEQYPGITVDILGRPGLDEVLASLTLFREYLEINLPVFGHHRRDGAAMLDAVRIMRRVRRRKYDFCVNFIGDVRENILGALTGAATTIAPCWEHGHLFKEKMTDKGAHYFARCCVSIPARYTGYYESMQHFAEQLGMCGFTWEKSAGKSGVDRNVSKIAIHPGASHPSRRWPPDKWKILAQRLIERGFRLAAIGAIDDRDFLTQVFGEQAKEGRLEIVTGDIRTTTQCLATVHVLIGMDSFSVHAACGLGVPAVVLNGSSDARVMTPPGCEAVSAGHQCRAYPCNYSYPCQGKQDEYICCRGIEVEEVLAAFDRVLLSAGPAV